MIFRRSRLDGKMRMGLDHTSKTPFGLSTRDTSYAGAAMLGDDERLLNGRLPPGHSSTADHKVYRLATEYVGKGNGGPLPHPQEHEDQRAPFARSRIDCRRMAICQG